VSKIVRLPDDLKIASDTFEVFDDFAQYTDAHLWTKVLTDSGTAAVAGVGGIANAHALGRHGRRQRRGVRRPDQRHLQAGRQQADLPEGLVQFSEANDQCRQRRLRPGVHRRREPDRRRRRRPADLGHRHRDLQGRRRDRLAVRHPQRHERHRQPVARDRRRHGVPAARIEILDVTSAGHMTVTFRRERPAPPRRDHRPADQARPGALGHRRGQPCSPASRTARRTWRRSSSTTPACVQSR
jgi:hypothetical protein